MTSINLFRLFLITGCVMFLVACNTMNDKQDFSQWQMVWFDEFDRDGLPDENKWTFEEGDGCPDLCGFGNNELQRYLGYSTDHSRIENGVLIIEAHKNEEEDSFTSAKLMSKPDGVWQYCKIDVRAKMPKGRGVWPAIWMLPSSNKYGDWPGCGEIDIMEYVGFEADSIYCALHTASFNHLNGTEKMSQKYLNDVNEEFHTYTLIWESDSIEFQIDGSTYYSFSKETESTDEWPFDQPFYLIMNLAVGGNWGGKMGVDPDIWPQQFIIDYVRVYQRI